MVEANLHIVDCTVSVPIREPLKIDSSCSKYLGKSFRARRADIGSTRKYGKEAQRRWNTFAQALR